MKWATNSISSAPAKLYDKYMLRHTIHDYIKLNNYCVAKVFLNIIYVSLSQADYWLITVIRFYKYQFLQGQKWLNFEEIVFRRKLFA